MAGEILCLGQKPLPDAVGTTRSDRQKMSFYLRLSGCQAAKGVPQKVMDVGHFAETKGVVGCHYRCGLVLKVRDWDAVLELIFLASSL
jgi:hypothetical protein